jgi:hypothetical protein
MAADDAAPQDVLEGNVGRLFGLLRKGTPMSDAARSRTLERLLQEASPRATHRHLLARRWVRWAGLAAALIVATALLTTLRHTPPTAGASGPAGRAGTAATETSTNEALVNFAIHLLATGPGQGVVEASSLRGGEPVRIHLERWVSNADVESARVVRTSSGCQVDISLTEEGTAKLARLTRDHIGEGLALVLDGKVVMTPTIRSEITQGKVALTGSFTDARCGEIARSLSARR